MWLLALLFLGAAPAWAEDLGELSVNPARLALIPIDQKDQADQFRLSVLAGLHVISWLLDTSPRTA
jgi:hypothetical protein